MNAIHAGMRSPNSNFSKGIYMQNITFIEPNTAPTEADLAAIDPDMRRLELEKHIGKVKTNVFLLVLYFLRQHGDVPELFR